MKKLILMITMLVVFISSLALAQVLTLNSAETLAVPTATKLDLRNINIDVTNKTVNVTYRFIAESGEVIPVLGGGRTQVDRLWQCRDYAAQDVAQCASVGVPYPGCTGPGTGVGLDPGSTCFADTFAFAIRTQDVGVQIGKGLRALIWAKMRPSVLTGANNATLP